MKTAKDYLREADTSRSLEQSKGFALQSIAVSLIELNERLRSIDRTLVETLGQLKRS